jgi:hypothetical protein
MSLTTPVEAAAAAASSLSGVDTERPIMKATTHRPLTISSLQPLQLTDAAKYSRLALAGGICASVTHLVTVPMDVVKTRLQVWSHSTHLLHHCPITYLSMLYYRLLQLVNSQVDHHNYYLISDIHRYVKKSV